MTKRKPHVPTDPNTLIDEEAAASYLAVSPRTLRNWRTRGGGPEFVKVSKRCIRYRIRDLDEWIDRRRRKSTSDLGIFR